MRTFFVRNLSLLAMFLLCGNLAFSQGYLFRVLANKGANQVKRATGTTEGLKTGATLKPGDQIIAGDGAYIGLMHKTGKTIEIRKSGIIKVNDLEKDVAAIKTSVTSRYAQYVMNKINEEEGGIRQNYRNNMNVTGAVSRALGEDEIGLVLPPGNKVNVYNSNLLVRWTAVNNVDTYLFTVKDIFNEVIFQQETDKLSMELDLDDESIKNESSLYIVTVTVKDNEEITSPSIAIQRTDLEDSPEVKTELETLKSEVDATTAMGKVIMATFYDEKGLPLDALTTFEALVKENPDVKDFKDLYEEFLWKNGMVPQDSKE